MISGLNSEVRFNGASFHVQTEDLGAREPSLESVVFVGGQLLRKVRRPYGAAEALSPEALHVRLVAQHRAMVEAILRGRLGGAPPPATGPALRPRLLVSDLDEPRSGAAASLLILVRDQRSFRPIPRAGLRVLFGGASIPPKPIYQGSTDLKGFHLADVEVPAVDSPDATLTVEAMAGNAIDRAVLPVTPSGPGAGAAVALEPSESPDLIVSDLGDPRAGERSSFLILVRRQPSCRPLAGASIRIDLLEGQAPPRPIYSATTDAKGFHLAEVEIPAGDSPGGFLLIEAATPLGDAEFAVPILAG